MPLCIQDPNDVRSEYLVNALLDASRGARIGGGAFAFLSAGGVQLLLRDQIFSDFLARGTFDLLVGVDAITDTAAIRALSQVKIDYPNLQARALIPLQLRSIFHPKIVWFDHGDGGLLVTGSGNLTAGGLRWNIEAFAVERLDANAMIELRSKWLDYLARTAHLVLALDDNRLIPLLERNAARRQAIRAAGVRGQYEAAEEEAIADGASPSYVDIGAAPARDFHPVDELPPIGPYTEILVAEIPRSGDRWRQANFDRATFFDYFGASQPAQHRIYLFHLRADGTLGRQEVRPAVAVISSNYRFELEAASGIAYPSHGRPIGVFAKVGASDFVYMLLMPTSEGHEQMTALLNSCEAPQPNSMRRLVFRAETVQPFWPTAPLWRRLTI